MSPDRAVPADLAGPRSGRRRRGGGLAQSVVDAGVGRPGPLPEGPTSDQVLAYDLAHAAAAVRTAEAALAYGSHGDTEARIACAFVADAVADLAARTVGRPRPGGWPPAGWTPARAFVATFRDPAFLASLADEPGPRHLDPDFELVRETFHRFAEDQIRPRAEHIHRANTDIPEEIIARHGRDGRLRHVGPRGVRRLRHRRRVRLHGHGGGHRGAVLGIARAPAARSSPGRRSSPGPWCTAGPRSRSSRWLPRLATGEVMGAVAVTEPDFGSDVAGVVTAATPHRRAAG